MENQTPQNDQLQKLREARKAAQSQTGNTPQNTSQPKPNVSKNPLDRIIKPISSTPQPAPQQAPKSPQQASQPVKSFIVPEAKPGVVAMQKPKVDKPFWEDAIDGVSAGWKQMKGGMALGTADYADMLPSVAATARPMGMAPLTGQGKGFDSLNEAYTRELDKQAKGLSQPALPGLRDFAKQEFAKADKVNEQADTESAGYFIGSMIPQTAGIATAIGVGAINPAAGMVLGQINAGALGLMASGMAAKEYDDYVAEKGLPVNANDKLGAMMLSTAAETASELIPVAKFVPKQFRGKMSKFIFGNTEIQAKKGAELLQEFANSSVSRKQKVSNVLRSIGEGAAVEGPTEIVAELGQEFSSWLYKEKEDRAGLFDKTDEKGNVIPGLIKRSAMALAGGSLMGGALGPMSYGAQQYQNRQRREQAGKVVIAQDKTTGEALEIMGVANPDKKTEGMTQGPAVYQAIRPNGKIIEINEDQVGAVVELPLNDFNEILKGKAKGEQLMAERKQQEAQQAQQEAQQSARGQFEQFSYTGADGIPMISQAKFNDQEVFITQMMPDGSAVIIRPDGEKKVIKQEGLTDINTIPLDQFVQNTVPPIQTPLVNPQNPIQRGEQVNIGGDSYVVTGFDQESGLVQLENEGDGSDFQTIDIATFEAFRTPQPTNEAEAEATPTPEEGAGKLREIFGAGDTVDLGGTTETKPEEQPQPQPVNDQPTNEISKTTLTKENVTERLNINNPFYKKVSKALSDLGLIKEYNPETGEGDVLGGYVQEISTGGFSSGKMLFLPNGDISFIDGDGNNVKFDSEGNVISENIKEVQDQKKKTEIEGLKDSIKTLKQTKESEEFKYKTVTEYDILGVPKKVRRLKTANELKESIDKINKQIEKSENELSALNNVQPPVTPPTQPDNVPAQPAAPIEGAEGLPIAEDGGQKPGAEGVGKAVQVEGNYSTLPMADLRRPNGSIGTQGFTSENLESLIDFIAGERGVQLPQFDDSKGTSRIKQLIEFLKSNPEAKNQILEYVKSDPVQVDLLPDGSYHLQDGNHRANLLNLIGIEELPILNQPTTNEVQQPQPTGQAGQKDVQNAENQKDSPKEGEGQKGVVQGGEVLTPTKKTEQKESTYETARKQGFVEKDGIKYERQKPVAGVKGSEVSLEFAKDINEKANYAVVEADQIQPSHKKGQQNPMHFIPEAQPKNRKSESSQESAMRIARSLDPAKVAQSPNPYSGSPVINSRGEVIQGNNRTDAIQQYWQINPQDTNGYKQYLIDNAAQFGLDPEQIKGMKNPVLTRMIGSADSRAIELGNYDVKDIESGGQRRIDPVATVNKLGKAERKALMTMMSQSNGNSLAEIVRDQIGKITKYLYDKGAINSTQLETILNPTTGEVKPAGIEDISAIYKQFLFQGGDTSLPDLFNALPDRVQKGIEKAIPDILNAPTPMLVELQEAIQAQNQFQASKTENFKDWVNQVDMFAGGAAPSQRYNPLSIKMVELFDKSKTQSEIVKLFKEYNRLTTGTEGNLLEGPVAGVAPKQAVKQIFGIDHDPIELNTKTDAGESKPTVPSDQPAKIEDGAGQNEGVGGTGGIAGGKPNTGADSPGIGGKAKPKTGGSKSPRGDNQGDKVKPNLSEILRGEKPKEEPKPAKSDQLSAEAQKKADELKDLFGDFFDAGKDKLQSGPINAEQIVIAGKIIAKASELGIVRFKQLIEWANQNIGTDRMRQYFDSFKAAFGANLMINNPEKENINEIAASKFEDYLVEEKEEVKSSTPKTKKELELEKLKLTNKALAHKMPGSPSHKQITDQIDAINKELEKFEDKPSKSNEYKFELALRPFSQSPYPKDAFIRFEQTPGSYFGHIVLNRPLTTKEIEQYQVNPDTQIEEIKGKTFKDSDGYYDKIELDWYGNENKFAKVLAYSDDFVDSSVELSAVNVLKNIESGYWKEIKNQQQQDNVSNRPTDSQPNQPEGEAPIQADNQPVSGGRADGGKAGGQNETGSGAGNKNAKGGKGSGSVSPTTSRITSIGDLFSQPSTGRNTGITDGRGDSPISPEGVSDGQGGNNVTDPATQEAIESFASKTAKRLEQQRKAESIPAKARDLDNIRETLPMLLPEQQEDVFKAENRFFDPAQNTQEKANAKGYLFTNGTGTGKTYSGLGIVKRFQKMGKQNILIITPSQTKVTDWIQDASNLGISATALSGTKDKGKGVNVTTFATFRANEAIFDRDFDLIIYDESHRLMEDKDGKSSSTTLAHQMNSNVNEDLALMRLKATTGLWSKERELRDQVRRIILSMNNPDRMDITLHEMRKEYQELERQADELVEKQKEILPDLKKRAAESVQKTKVVFLSATPFKSVFNLRYANGVLFDWGNRERLVAKSRGMSRVNPEGQFFLDNFGSQFEWKNNQLQTKSKVNPEAVAMQEIAFNAKLNEAGVMSGRAIESDMDYRRDFPILTGEKSDRFNDAVNRIFDHKTKEFDGLRAAAVDTFFESNYVTQLLESMKATLLIPRLQEHIKLGRKAVIFHRRQQSNIEPPFFKIVNTSRIDAQSVLLNPNAQEDAKAKAREVINQADAFEAEFKDLLAWEKTLDYRSAVEQLREAFGDQIRFQNGQTSDKEKKSGVHVKDFNQVGGPVKIIMVQEESGKEGISLHDTSGKEPRVLVSLSMPRSSTTALQIEGRTYRIGVSSNAIYEYPVLGLDFEVAHFASNINKKLSTTENLAMGDSSRDLLNSFVAGIQTATDDAPNLEQGKGGKDLDKRYTDERSQFRKAVLYYQTNQKTRGRRDQREGVDFYATPEPVGQKMVEFLGLEPMEKVLEPSAGKGAIAMWFPGFTNRTVIEPSMSLFGKLSAVTSGATQENMTFEDLNIINKYHGIAMNPPFGSAGKTAMDHVEKALKHLYDGGRVVALVPRGQMDKRLEEFLESKDGKNFYMRGEILLPSATFDQAGTQVNTRIVIIDKVEKPVNASDLENIQPFRYDLTRAKTVDELFDSIEDFTVSERIEVQDRKAVMDQLAGNEEVSEDAPAKPVKEITEKAESGDLKYKEGKHTQTGEILHLVEMTKQLDNFGDLNRLSKSLGGFYDRYSKAFRFKTKEKADEFIQKGTLTDPDQPMAMRQPQTSSKAFKAWFGDSKVVDSEGKPMVVYHGTGADFNVFDLEKAGSKTDSGMMGKGFYFTTDIAYANRHAGRGINPQVLPVYLSIKNPFRPNKDFSNLPQVSEPQTLEEMEVADITYSNEIREKLIQQGYDGVIHQLQNGEKEIVAFQPTQIKSATGNQGTFDPNNPDIRASRPTSLSSVFASVQPSGKKLTKGAEAISKKAAEFSNDWNNAPKIRTFNNAQEVMQAYPQIADQYSEEELQDIPALFIGNTSTGEPEVALIATHSYFGEKGGVEKALLHEIIGHYGVRETLRRKAKGDRKKYVDEYNKLMAQVFEAKKNDPFLADIVDRYFGKPVSELTEKEQIIAADEYLAHLAQDGVSDKWIDRVVAKLRQILRQIGFEFGLSDSEIRNILGNSMRIVRGPQGRPVMRQGVDQTMATMIQENQNAQVINGFYSPIEQRILDFKQPKASATKWKEIVGKKDEAQWTGVYQYLDGLKPDQQISKQELLDWMKENRVEIQEIQKGQGGNVNEIQKDNTYNNIQDELSRKGIDDSNGVVDQWYDGNASWSDVESFLNENNIDVDFVVEKSKKLQDDTKFSEYQLEGDKTDYKEVLVTLPFDKSKLSFNINDEVRVDLHGSEQFGLITDIDKSTENKPYTVTIDGNEYYFNKSEIKTKTKERRYFTSSHFDEPNILVHLRMNTRTAADGSKVLFLEELQSDWGQKGKRTGFKKSDSLIKLQEELVEAEKAYEKLDFVNLSVSEIWNTPEAKRVESIKEQIQKEQSLTPPAPFVTDTNSWIKLGLKVAMKEAVAQGADRIAWTTGTQQNERYDLSKQVDYIQKDTMSFMDGPESTLVDVSLKQGGMLNFKIDPSTGEILYQRGSTNVGDFTGKNLEEVIGKEMAQKVISAGLSAKFEGKDLSIGGTGMKAFYGDPSVGDIGMVGRVAESIVGKGMVGTTEIPSQKQDVKINREIIDIEDAPEKVQEILNKYGEKDSSIENAIKLQAKLKPLGYEVDYDMDGSITEIIRVSGKPVGLQQHSIPVNSELTDQVLMGLPMFMRQSNDQTQTPAFKAWFGDSKVVDEDGKPLVVYHGTTQKNITVFNPIVKGADGFGSWFTENPETAKQFSRDNNGFNEVMPVYLSIKNPWVLEGNDGWNDYERVFKDKTGVKQLANANAQDVENFKTYLKLSGKDGIILKNINDLSQDQSDTYYVAIEPTQIKSATGNSGNFDGNDPDIRALKVGSTPAVEAARKENWYQSIKASLTENKSRANSARLGLRWDFQDQMLPGKRLLEAAFGTIGNTPDKQNFYVQENLYKDKILYLENQYKAKFSEPLKKITDAITKQYGVNFDQINDYLMALHNEERRRQIFTDKLGKVKNGEWQIPSRTAKKLAEEILDNVENLSDFVSDPQILADLKSDDPKVKAEARKQAKQIINDTFLADIQSDVLAKRLAARQKLIERRMRDKESVFPSGMSQNEADEIMAEFESKVPQEERDALTKQIQAINQESIKIREEAGLLSKKGADILRNQYKNYVPLRGLSDKIEDDSTVFSPLMKAHGRSSRASNPIAYLHADMMDAIHKAEHNKVLQSLLEFLKTNISKNANIDGFFLRKGEDADGNETWFELPEGIRPSKAELESGEIKRGFDPEVMERAKFDTKPSELTVSAMVNGQKVKMRFVDTPANRQLVSTLNKTNIETLNAILKPLGWFNRILSRLFTSYSPEFGFVNLIRDAGLGSFRILAIDNPRILIRTMKEAPKSIKQLYQVFGSGMNQKSMTDPFVKEFFESGAFTGYAIQESVSEIYKQFKATPKKDRSIFLKGLAKLDPTGLKNFMDMHNSAIENTTRLSYYKALRKEGYSVQQAAAKAKDLTVNFRRRGNKTGQAQALYMFLNANIQGSSAFLEPFMSKEKGARSTAWLLTSGLMTAGLSQGIALALLSGDEEDEENPYAELSEYERNMNIIIPVGGGEFFKLPIGFGPNIPYAMGEMIGSLIVGNSDLEKTTIRFLSLLTSTFSPIGGIDFDSQQSMDEQAFRNITPTVVKPAVDIMINKNFMGYQIYPENPYDTNKPDSETAKRNTNPLAILAAKGLNKMTGGTQFEKGMIDVHPDAIEYTIRQYVGGPGYFLDKSIQTISTASDGENPLNPETLNKVPFVSRFLTSAQNSRTTTRQFFEAKKEIEKAMGLYEDYLNVGDTINANRIMTKYERELSLYEDLKGFGRGNDRVNGLDYYIEGLNDQIDYAKANNAPKEEIRDLENTRTILMQEFVNNYKDKNPNKPKKSLKEILGI